MIPRKRHIGRKILLVVLVVLIAVIGVVAFAKQETLRLLFNPGNITVNNAGVVAAMVREGSYEELIIEGDAEGEMRLEYLIPDGSIRIRSEFSGGEADGLSGEVYTSRLKINTVTQALELAEELLLPYFSQPEIEALELGLVGTIVQNALSPYIDFTTAMGPYTVTAHGDTVGGTVAFRIDIDGR